ncbi:MAG TPA: hypothetical protein VH115_10960 [Solirubrobacteraceae bacterium]|nr:hypothetical protein [Solirubrobacteraceae bacterium]
MRARTHGSSRLLVLVRLRALALATVAPGLAALAACGSAQGGGAAAGAPAVSGGAAARASAGTAAPAAPAAPAPPCGAATGEALTRTVGMVATRIYGNELASGEVSSDRRQVEGFTPLLEAVAAGDRAATRAAVTTIVYSHTHIVRLRVTRAGAVLADVGGPYILAPVSGSLRRRGRTVGRYEFSVQDDSGYVKLVTRFIGTPLVVRSGSHTLPVEGALYPAPANLPAHGQLSFRGGDYEVFTLKASAFPSGALEISLLVRVPSALAREPCSELHANELGDVARRVSRRFALAPSNLGLYIDATAPLTSGLIFIRTAGAHPRELAASAHPIPPSLPARGTVTYRGRAYRVFSFTAPSSVGTLRISQLVRE